MPSIFSSVLCASLLAVTACAVEDSDITNVGDSEGAVYGGNSSDSLSWRGLTKTCSAASVPYEGNLSIAFNVGDHWTTCSVHGTVRVPAGVKLTSLYQAVRGSGWGRISYSSRVGGSLVTSRSAVATTGVETTASIASLGASLCRSGGAHDVSVSFTVSGGAKAVYLDSVDWYIDSEECP